MEKTKETLLVTNKCVAVLALVFKLLFNAEIMSRSDPCVLKIVFVKKGCTCLPVGFLFQILRSVMTLELLYTAYKEGI